MTVLHIFNIPFKNPASHISFHNATNPFFSSFSRFHVANKLEGGLVLVSPNMSFQYSDISRGK